MSEMARQSGLVRAANNLDASSDSAGKQKSQSGNQPLLESVDVGQTRKESAPVLYDVETGAEVRHVAERILVDKYICRVQHDRTVRARVHPFRWRRRYEG